MKENLTASLLSMLILVGGMTSSGWADGRGGVPSSSRAYNHGGVPSAIHRVGAPSSGRAHYPSPGHGGYSGWHHNGSAGHRGFRAGDLLAGVLIGGLLCEILAPPARVIYPTTVYSTEVVYAQPHVAYSPPVYPPVYPPVVRYVPPPEVFQQVPYVPREDTVWIPNSNGSRTPVRLRRTDGGMYIGPKGEYYQGVPNGSQLRQLYGM